MLVIFAKEPMAGKVKTRLEKSFPPRTVLALYKSFVLDTLKRVAKVPRAEKIIFYESWGNPPKFLRKNAPAFHLIPQCGANLGDRLSAAYEQLAPSPKHPVVIIGADTPHLDPERILDAFRLLRTHDAVIGPAEDGGFYLLGLTAFSEGIFEGISWSTKKVSQKLLQNLRKKKLRYSLLPEEYDLDTPADLHRLFKQTSSASSKRPDNLSRCLRCRPSNARRL